MTLLVTRLSLTDFRSYESFTLEPDARLTVLVGPNAAGKTNVIEALQLLSSGESFRKPSWGDVVRWGADESRIAMAAEGEGRTAEVELSLSRLTGRRTYKVNGKVKRSTAEAASLVPNVLFTPDDLRLVKESAEKRRGAVDALGVQLSASYAALKAEYDRVVRQRNALLKEDNPSDRVMDALEERLVDTGVKLTASRRRLFERLGPVAEATYASLAEDGPLTATYVSAAQRDGACESPELDADTYRAHLRSKHAEERARASTLCGPHRDDIVFEIAGREARGFASQGQQRTISLAWKIAEVAVVTQISGKRPLLLLDDVMSELDESRRHALTAHVGGEAQTVVTTTNLGYFEPGLLASAKVVEVP